MNDTACEHATTRMEPHAYDECEDCRVCFWCGIPADEHEGTRTWPSENRRMKGDRNVSTG